MKYVRLSNRRTPISKRTPEARFVRFVPRDDARRCWEWQGYVRPNGYGRFMVAWGKAFYAHRFAYELWRGPIPEGLVVDHVCGNRACVNPAHLRAVSQRVNLRSSPRTVTAINAAKTHCAHGHPLDAAGARVNKYGWRICRACKRERVRKQARQRRQVWHGKAA